MNVHRLATFGVSLAPAVGLATGVWAEWADLTPPLLLSIAVPAIVVSTLSAAYLARALGRPAALALLGAAVGLLTFSMSAGLYIAIHLLRGGGLDLNGADDGGSAGVFFAVHLGVGTVVGLVVGVAIAVVLLITRALRLRERSISRSTSA